LTQPNGSEYRCAMPRPRKPPKKGEPSMVKTTLLLPEELWQRAKIRALGEHRDLRELLLEGLELVLRRGKGGK
jgi:hypothetical protein